MLRSFAAMILVSVTACTPYPPQVVVHTSGEVNPIRDDELSTSATRTATLPKGVRVIQGTIPEGLTLEDQGTKLTVHKGFESKYEVLGTIEVDYRREQGVAILKSGYWTWAFHGKPGMKALCYPQAPLKLLTLGIWNIVPTAYPCFLTVGTEKGRRIGFYEGMMKGAAAMGGNLVLIVGEGGQTTITVSNTMVSTQHHSAMSQVGFVLRDSKP